MKALLTCLFLCPLTASRDKVSVQGVTRLGLLAPVGLDHIPGKSPLGRKGTRRGLCHTGTI